MNAKKIVSLLFLLSFSDIFSSIDPSPYQKDAQVWIEHYIQKDSRLIATPDDLQLIANLFYFSYWRSLKTIKAQSAARKAFESLWHSWQNIAHTRMNPSLPAPHVIDIEKQQQLYEEFLKAQQEHRHIGLVYSQAAQIAVKEHYLSTPAQEGVIRLREQARTVVAQAFLDAKKVVGDLYDIALQGLRQPEHDNPLRFDVIETISYYLPILSMQSFIEAEKTQLKASEQSWEVIRIMLEVNMSIWDSIESTRASFYLAHYNAVIESMTKNALAKKYWHIIIDEQGFNRKSTEFLPKKIS